MHRTDSILRRKAGHTAVARAGQGDSSSAEEAGAVSVSRLLRRAVARAAQHEIGLQMAVLKVADDTAVSLTELLDMVEPGALLAVLEGPGEDLGMMAWACELIEGVVQHQTTGAVRARLGDVRRPTRTDAAMSAALIDRIMRELEGLLSRPDDLGWVGGYRYASYLEEPRTLGLLLEDVSYRCCTMQVDMGEGRRAGTILLALPSMRDATGRARHPESRGDQAVAVSAADEAARWQAAIEQAVMGCAAQLDAVLGRSRVPLARLMAWTPGDVIALPTARLDRVALCAGDGRKLAMGRLGQSRGYRALRLSALANDNVAEPERAPSPALAGGFRTVDAASAGPGPLHKVGAGTASEGEAETVPGASSAPMPGPLPSPMPATMPGPVPGVEPTPGTSDGLSPDLDATPAAVPDLPSPVDPAPIASPIAAPTAVNLPRTGDALAPGPLPGPLPAPLPGSDG